MIDHAIPSGDRPELNLLAALILAGAFCEAVLSFSSVGGPPASAKASHLRPSGGAVQSLARMPISFFTRTKTGALVSRMNNDVIGAQRAVTGTLGSVVSNTITLTTVLITLFILQCQLTLLALVLLPLFLLPRGAWALDCRHPRESMNQNRAMNTQMTERFNVSGALLVKLFGRPSPSSTSSPARRPSASHRCPLRDVQRVVVIALTLVGAVGTAAVYWIGGKLAISVRSPPAPWPRWASLVARIYMPLTSLTNARIDVMSALVSFERGFECSMRPTPSATSPTPRHSTMSRVRSSSTTSIFATRPPTRRRAVTRARHRAQLHGGERRSATRRRSVDRTRATVALVGPSGAGKTTRHRSSHGSTTSRAAQCASMATTYAISRRAACISRSVVVSQDPHLFHDTVMANLRYARPAATFDEVRAACRAAQIHDVITALPDGYDTWSASAATDCRAGRKATPRDRALLVKDPAIVVLDEATSHLDSENESLVQQALANALADRTAIVIATPAVDDHQRRSDRGLDEGRVVERGRHEELRGRRVASTPTFTTRSYATTARVTSPNDRSHRPDRRPGA